MMRHPHAWAWPTSLIAAFLGLFAAGVLSLGYILKLPVPCGVGGGCGAVAHHPSSSILGVRLAYLGVAAYVTIIVLLVRAARGPAVRGWVVVLTGLGTIASVMLLVYARTVIGATCWWCVGSGAAMTLTFVSSVLLLRGRGIPIPVRPAGVWSLTFLTAVGLGLAAGWMQRAASRPPISAERLAQVEVAELIDPVKSLGPTDAEVTVVVFADFHCPACRSAHASLKAYQRSHPRGVRLVFRHLPFWRIRGHEFSRAAAALSEMAGERGVFWAFADAVYEQGKMWRREDYLQLMRHLGLESAEVEARLAAVDDPAIARVLRDEALAERLGIEHTPTFIVVLPGRRPASASQRSLPRLLNSPEVKSRLAAREEP